jgi:hypothetical protein
MLKRCARRIKNQCAREEGATLAEFAISFPLYMLVAVMLGALSWWWWNQTVVATSITDGVRAASVMDSSPADGYGRARNLLQAGLGGMAGPYLDNIAIFRSPDQRSVSGTIRGYIHVWFLNWNLPVQSSSFQRMEQFYPGPPDPGGWE